MTPLWIVLGLAVLIALGFVVSYNRFVRQRNLVQESWRQVDVELTRRHDLIPNLVETVKGYAAHERTVLEAVTDARTQAQAAATGGAGPAGQAQAENTLVRSLGGLFAVAENYPTLKADTNFLALQQQLGETEDRIAAGRRFYNGNVRALNTRIEAFPSSIVAGIGHFTKADYFQTDDPAVRAPVTVDFGSHRLRRRRTGRQAERLDTRSSAFEHVHQLDAERAGPGTLSRLSPAPIRLGQRIRHQLRRFRGFRVANIKSQIKRIGTNEKARLRNKAVKSSLKTHVRRFREAADAGSPDAPELLRAANRQLDKAASKGVIHANQAANRKSALAKRAASL